MDCFLYDNGLRHERVNESLSICYTNSREKRCILITVEVNQSVYVV